MIDLLEPETHVGVRYHAAVSTQLRRAERAGWTGQRDETSESAAALRRLFRAVGRFGVDGITDAVAEGADVNGRNEAGWTPLNCAIHNGNRKAVIALLASGAEVDAPADDLGRTALWIAINQRQVDLLAPLMAAGADPNVTDQNGRSLWQRATDRGIGQALRQASPETHDSDLLA